MIEKAILPEPSGLENIPEPLEHILTVNLYAVVCRGLIDETTTFNDFKLKLLEELNELENEYDASKPPGEEFKAELMDCICVLTNMALHYDIDIRDGMIKNAEKNFKRA
jgi:uncharacterized protein YabN with tetrapyrrole methylase and pyrophosphatase domain